MNIFKNWQQVILFICFCRINAVHKPSFNYSTSTEARVKFEKQFINKCQKYPFVQKFQEMLRRPFSNYLIFVYHEPGQSSNGGLGDRLAGMITALAFAIRSNRTFLIVGDESFEKSFRPYYDNSLSFGRSEPSWANWDWSGWKREFSANMTKLHCVNPRPSHRHCALDRDLWKGYKVIKYFGNRSYLCRWNIKSSLQLQSELLDSLGIKSEDSFFVDGKSNSDTVRRVASEVDLYEVGGCLLRLAISPSDLLWQALDEALHTQLDPLMHSLSTQSSTPPTIREQIGFHFRCGDSSFAVQSNPNRKKNPECWVNTTSSSSLNGHNDTSFSSWQGTSFTDDTSMDSPVDYAHCGFELLNNHSYNEQNLFNSSSTANGSNTAMTLLYIASDNPDSSQQINETLLSLLLPQRWKGQVGLIRPPRACHVDMANNQQGRHCSLQTAVHWFMLAQSDRLIMQALVPPKGPSMYLSDREGARYDRYSSAATLSAPVSAFSRYAALYSLRGDIIHYGRSCSGAVSMALLSHQTHGNWVCDPKMFY